MLLLMQNFKKGLCSSCEETYISCMKNKSGNIPAHNKYTDGKAHYGSACHIYFV